MQRYIWIDERYINEEIVSQLKGLIYRYIDKQNKKQIYRQTYRDITDILNEYYNIKLRQIGRYIDRYIDMQRV